MKPWSVRGRRSDPSSGWCLRFAVSATSFAGAAGAWAGWCRECSRSVEGMALDAQCWDAKYRGRDRLFSGAPNGVLVAEVADLAPGRALDVGCGEGADALWLARRGWQVTGVDISETALRRAAAAGA